VGRQQENMAAREQHKPFFSITDNLCGKNRQISKDFYIFQLFTDVCYKLQILEQKAKF
jgi:hypothetical protein